MGSKTKDWTAASKDQMTDIEGVAIWVSDGVTGYYRSLWHEDIEKALDDYASGYKCDPQEITVDWSIFDDGEEVKYGQHTFNVE